MLNTTKKKLTGKDVEKILIAMKELDVISLNTPVGHDEDAFETELGELLPSNEPTPEELCIKRDREVIIQKYLDMFLTERQADVIRMRFGFNGRPMTLEEVGRELCLTRERVRQIEARALRRLRANFMRNKISEETV